MTTLAWLNKRKFQSELSYGRKKPTSAYACEGCRVGRFYLISLVSSNGSQKSQPKRPPIEHFCCYKKMS